MNKPLNAELHADSKASTQAVQVARHFYSNINHTVTHAANETSREAMIDRLNEVSAIIVSAFELAGQRLSDEDRSWQRDKVMVS